MPQPANRQQQQPRRNSTPTNATPVQQPPWRPGGSLPSQPQQQPRHSTNPSAAAGRTSSDTNARRTGRGGNNDRQGRPPWR